MYTILVLLVLVNMTTLLVMELTIFLRLFPLTLEVNYTVFTATILNLLRKPIHFFQQQPMLQHIQMQKFYTNMLIPRLEIVVGLLVELTFGKDKLLLPL